MKSPVASPNQTYEVTLSCPPKNTVALSEVLWTLPDVTAVMEEYDDEIVHRAVSQGAEGWVTSGNLKWLKVFSNRTDIRDAVTALIHDQGLTDCRIINERTIAEEDWAESWKQHWDITRVPDRIVIRPSWLEYIPKTGETVIDLDPGSAFGTGTHSTTRLMLTALEQLADSSDFSRLSLLDVGTGSGILAVYAALRGCRDIRAIDVDPFSVSAAQENAARNGVESVIQVSDNPLGEMCHTRYDIVTANIIAPVILELWDDLLLRLAPNGTLLLSGLIGKNLAEIHQKLTESGLENIIEFNDGDWYAIQGQKP
jgi:ribosomal protein L11 methyltransferase